MSFIERLFILRVSFGFHGPPLLTFKTDQLDLRGLDLEKMTSFTHYLKISASKRNLLPVQNRFNSLKAQNSHAHMSARVQNVGDFPQTKPYSEHGDPHFLFYKFNENNILNN